MEFAVERAPAAPASVHGAPERASLPGTSDGELLVAIAAGDRNAFEEIHRRYYRAMLGIAINRLGDRGKAEDAVQEAFISIWRAASTYRPERGPGAPWIFAVTRNAVISRWRKRQEPAAEPFDHRSPDPGPAELAEQSWRSFRVHRALETLPDHQRRLIELAYWGGLTQSEIAAELEIPLGTVKTRTRAALSELAVVLGEEME
jgi:RNA polymerase sigma-70 factor (ECF subfamily)